MKKTNDIRNFLANKNPNPDLEESAQGKNHRSKFVHFNGHYARNNLNPNKRKD